MCKLHMFAVKSVDTGCELLFLKTLDCSLVVATKIYTLAFFFFKDWNKHNEFLLL